MHAALISAIATSLVLAVLLFLMWRIIMNQKNQSTHHRHQSKNIMQSQNAHNLKDSPTIALIMIVPTKSTDADTNVQAACIWNNIIATPYNSGRVRPMVVKLQCSESPLGSPVYSYCKTAYHSNCRINDSIQKLFTLTCNSDRLYNMTCVHCPATASDGQFSDQVSGISDAIQHLKELNEMCDYVCIISADTCLSYAWDEKLVEEYSSMKNDSMRRDMDCTQILCSPVETIEEAVQYVAAEREDLQRQVRAQYDRHATTMETTFVANDDVNTNPNSHLLAKLGRTEMRSVGVGALIRSSSSAKSNVYMDDIYASMSSSLALPGVDTANLETVLWSSCRRGFWLGAEPVQGMKITPPMPVINLTRQRLKLDHVKMNRVATFTPWWTEGCVVMMSSADANDVCSVIDDANNPSFNCVEWSMALLSHGILCSGTLQSYGVLARRGSKSAMFENSHLLPYFPTISEGAGKSWIDKDVVSKMMGLNVVEQGGGFDCILSNDAKFGLLALGSSSFKDDLSTTAIVNICETIKQHDILCRCASWASYLSSMN